MNKLIIGITSPGSIGLLKGQLKYFSDKGYKTFLLSPKNERVIRFCKDEKCGHLEVEIRREISLINDLSSLFRIIRILRNVKPDIVNFGTPKMGLLGSLAAKICGVKTRIYTCRGFRYEHEKGTKRLILKTMERIAGACADKIICISTSIKELAIKEKIFNKAKCIVIGKGSSNGIELNDFRRSIIDNKNLENLKEKLGLNNYFVFGFLGRIIDRKGIRELFYAFKKLYSENKNLKLLIVGPIEIEQIQNKDIIKEMESHEGIVMTGRTDEVQLHLSCMDVFVLPAWGEGFGNVLIQAAAMGIPVISTTGTGTIDAVKNGFNGILVKPKSIEDLTDAMIKLFSDGKLRQEMGKNGIEWAKNFDNRIIWKGLEELYSGRV